MDAFIRNIRIALRAETLIAETRFRLALKKTSASLFAGLICIFGLGMANLAGFFALVPAWGDVYAALGIAAGDFVLAFLLLNWARGLQPGPEIELAREVSHAAQAEIEAQTAEVQAEIKHLRNEVLSVRDTLGGFARSPMDSAANALIGPLLAMIVKALTSRSKKE